MSDPVDRVLRDYYEARAPVYDAVYAGVAPPWVDDMVAALANTLRGRRVLEVACGTGHWTGHAAAAAAAVTAVDASPAMLAIAAAKLAGRSHVTVARADAYTMDGVGDGFTGGLAMQWLSHVPAARRDEFFRAWHARLAPGAAVFLGDNQLTPAWLDRLVRPAGSPDTYEPRELPDGSSYLIVKNYFTDAQLRDIVAPHGEDVTVTMGDWWWWLSYRAR